METRSGMFDLSSSTDSDLRAVDALVKFVGHAINRQTEVSISETSKRARDELKRSMDATDQNPVYLEIDETTPLSEQPSCQSSRLRPISKKV